MALWGEPGAMIDACYTYDLRMQLSYNNYKHNTFLVIKIKLILYS